MTWTSLIPLEFLQDFIDPIEILAAAGLVVGEVGTGGCEVPFMLFHVSVDGFFFLCGMFGIGPCCERDSL